MHGADGRQRRVHWGAPGLAEQCGWQCCVALGDLFPLLRRWALGLSPGLSICVSVSVRVCLCVCARANAFVYRSALPPISPYKTDKPAWQTRRSLTAPTTLSPAPHCAAGTAPPPRSHRYISALGRSRCGWRRGTRRRGRGGRWGGTRRRCFAALEPSVAQRLSLAGFGDHPW